MTGCDGVASPTLATARAVLEGGSFEEAIAALETVVGHLERGQLSLAESLAWYELGLRLSRRCEELLQQAELRISTIEERFAIEAPGLAPWESDDP